MYARVCLCVCMAAMKSLKALKGEDASLKEQEKSLQAQLEVLGKKGKELKTWQQKLKTKEKNLEKLLDEPSLEQETRRITKLLDGARARQHKQLTKMVDSYTAMLQISGRHDVVALQVRLSPSYPRQDTAGKLNTKHSA